MRPRSLAALLLVAVALAAVPRSVGAAYDMSGAWLVVLPGSSYPPSHWDVVQSSGTLTFSIWYAGTAWTTSGTIDEATGTFTQEVGDIGGCGADTLEGLIAADGKSFTATHTILYFQPGGSPTMPGHCTGQTLILAGSRCGNAVLDDGEACDDGNASDGDCCTPTCTLGADGNACSELHGCGSGTCTSGSCVLSSPAPAGTSCTSDANVCTDDVCDGGGACTHPGNTAPCASDGNVCTDDVCDGSGVCTHPGNTAPCASDGNVCTDDVCDGSGSCGHVANAVAHCSEPHGCGTGSCAGGSCIVSTPAMTGWPCDLDASACTPDACDGAGTCVTGPVLDCTPCGTCDATYGCVADLAGCDAAPDRVSLTFKTDPTGGNGERLTVEIRDIIDAADLGDPTSATGYTLCLYRSDGSVQRPISAMVIPAGGTCRGRSCWKPLKRGFLYKDGDRAADGIGSIRLDREKGIKVLGKQERLPLPATLLPNPELAITPKVVATDGLTTRCWYHAVPADKYSPTTFKGRYSAP